ncbi:MAG: putative peptidoglycan glycosyltransferase FtsW [Lachnospiraceae bacterium]|nr:putative peptidoglycan glycosyltransferase FtsW [Lachnospiraceae bacterium]
MQKSGAGPAERNGARPNPQLQRGPRVQERPPSGGHKGGKTRRFYDYSLLFTIIFLTVFGLVMIYSSSSYSAQLKFNDAAHFMKRQGFIALGGFFVMLVISKMNYHFFAKFAALAYIVSYVMMFLVMFTPLGIEANGKKRWLGVGPLQFQPTELVKIALIVLLAVVITQLGSKMNQLKSLFLIVGLTVPIAGMVAANNLSSGIIILGIAFVMSFVASQLKWPFLLCGAGAGLVVAFAGPIATFLEKMGIMHSYQLSRIYVWLEPEAYPQDGGYQVLQGLYAIGSGGLFGKGLGESIQKLGFVPEAQNDMVFSIICEELGIFGAVSVILIFMFMIYRFMLIASNAPDLFGAMLVVGVMGHIAIQVILNIAVVTNTIPNTGITLPFISYGGTSVVFLMMEMGMVLSVSNQIRLQK